MSFWSKLAKIAGVGLAPFTGGTSLIATGIGAAGEALGGMAEASAQNRGSAVDVSLLEEQLSQARQRQYQDYSVAREADRRESGSDAFRNMQRAEYVANAKGYQPKPGMTSYGFGPKGSTEAERAGAAQFLAEQQRRLRAGDSLLPGAQDPGAFRVDPKLVKPGKFEQFANIAAPIATGVSAIARPAGFTESQYKTLIEVLKAVRH